mmetsp:Transcript_4444/g.9286  ORF Transcript_4444/g.9286 Transcript_4444/m.9286 type:complete len:318 (+) Transcript_4444:808-1761(+)
MADGRHPPGAPPLRRPPLRRHHGRRGMHRIPPHHAARRRHRRRRHPRIHAAGVHRTGPGQHGERPHRRHRRVRAARTEPHQRGVGGRRLPDLGDEHGRLPRPGHRVLRPAPRTGAGGGARRRHAAGVPVHLQLELAAHHGENTAPRRRGDYAGERRHGRGRSRRGRARRDRRERARFRLEAVHLHYRQLLRRRGIQNLRDERTALLRVRHEVRGDLCPENGSAGGHGGLCGDEDPRPLRTGGSEHAGGPVRGGGEDAAATGPVQRLRGAAVAAARGGAAALRGHRERSIERSGLRGRGGFQVLQRRSRAEARLLGVE